MTARLNRAVLIAAVVTAQLVAAGASPRVAIIKSTSVGPFNEAADAIVDALRRDPLQPEILPFDLGGDEARAAAVLAGVRRGSPRLIITVGSLATTAALAEPSTVPVVFSMVLYPRQSGFLTPSSGRVTGASLDVPLETQFTYLHRLFPTAHRVGVLYHPDETGLIIEQAREAAKARGLDLVADSVDEPARAVQLLSELMDRVDVVWSVADSHVFTAQTTSALLLAALRHRVPLLGLSTAHVRAGAVAALSCDYSDIGRQTAELALRALRGEDAGSIPVSVPRTVALVLNLRTARHLHLDIPHELEAEAREVIR